MTVRIPLWAHRLVDLLRELKLSLWLALPTGKLRQKTDAPRGVVIGMTSYPARIQTAWKAVETLLRQDVPGIPVVLVLATNEFPHHKLPRRLASQTQRGLEILWVEKNGKSFDKLLPVRAHYPEATIITVDDDKYFPPDTIKRLLEAHAQNPRHIVGTRGWRVIKPTEKAALEFGVAWERSLPGDEGRGLHLPGGNGCLYPSGSLDPIVDDLDLAMRLCPTADDMWFWAAAHQQKTPFLCLGMPAHRPVGSQSRTPALSKEDTARSLEQFRCVVDHFGFTDNDIVWAAPSAGKKK
jgi:hypothetical protein